MAETDGMFGMGGWGILIILFVLLSGGFGAYGRGAEQYATSAEVQRGFDNQNSMANQRETLSAVNAGTAQAVAATNQTFHDLLGALDNRYGEIVRDISGIQVAQAQALANQNACCCETLRAIDGVNYANALNTASINAVSTANTQKVLDALAQNKIDSLESKVAELQLANQMASVVRYPTSWTYTAGTSPFCGGCGCVA